ncbi:MAG TPA: hypothetical protein VHS99_23090 [Chloroflexota bacterium]|nr:hypothetical protein [Chloroflexota bacterium]
MTAKETPKFTGITIHRDPRGRFVVRYPTGWHTFEIRSDEPLVDSSAFRVPRSELSANSELGTANGELEPAGREGIGFAPDAHDPHTALTVWAAPLEEPAVAEDLEPLKAGLDEGLRQLDDCRVELASDTVLGNLLRFERIYTFRERPQHTPSPIARSNGAEAPPAVRKRKQWLLYVDRWLLCVTWQGSDPQTYDYWLAMANQCFLTFEIPEALWFYTDRELLAQLRPGSTGSTGNPDRPGSD